MAFKGSGELNQKLYPLLKNSKGKTNPNDVERNTGKVKKTRGIYPVIVQARDI